MGKREKERDSERREGKSKSGTCSYRGRESKTERERERDLADLNDSITDDVGAVVSLLVSGHGLDLCLLPLLPTQTKNTETNRL